MRQRPVSDEEPEDDAGQAVGRQARRVRRRMEKLAARQFQEIDAARVLEGEVFRKAMGFYHVRGAGRDDAVCTISSKLRKRLHLPEADPSSSPAYRLAVRAIDVIDPVAVGDRVRFVDAAAGEGQIVDVLPRRTALTRRAAGAKPVAQTIVSNIDQVVPILSTADPEPRWNLLDRYLASIEASGVEALVCITKTDLPAAAIHDGVLAEYEALGYRVVRCSAVTGEGIDALRAGLAGRASVLIGKSGVGKTTLLGLVQPGLRLRVAEVSAATGKGRHTTTHIERYDLAGGGAVVDTPGMREFGLWQVPDDRKAFLFRELRPFLGGCRFAGCTHVHEPGCAVRAAVEAGAVGRRRYESYVRLLDK